jgi:hypothetical protein
MFPLKRRRPTVDVTGLSHKLMDLIDLHLNHLFVIQVCVCILTCRVSYVLKTQTLFLDS